VAALVGAVIRELTAEEPVVELRLLGERNFALAVFLMFVLGAVLVGTTVLIPLFLQSLMGYTAMLAGLALSPGGLVTMATMPLVGYLSSRVQPRWLIAFGFVMVALSLHRLSGADLQVSFRFPTLARMIMAGGLGFLFIPINVAAYAFVPAGKNNAASGLINLARNVGSSIGVSMVTTLIDRREQFHQMRLVEHLTPFDPAYRAAVHSTQAMAAAGAAAPALSQAQLYAQLQRQAGSLAFLDGFHAMMVAALVAVPLVLLLKRVDTHKAHASPH
jgi:DHA2 family multidrug resistance protein